MRDDSVSGMAMLKAAGKAVNLLRGKDGPPICLLIDGLERLNGESAQRFREVFHETRLLAAAPWASVVAGPPCTLSVAAAAEPQGWETRDLSGLGQGSDGVCRMLERRIGFDGEAGVPFEKGAVEHAAEYSGGIPRHGVEIVADAIDRAWANAAPRVLLEHVKEACVLRANKLVKGLSEEHVRVLRRVHEDARVIPSGDQFATLFFRGAILLRAGSESGAEDRYEVHPLIHLTSWLREPG